MSIKQTGSGLSSGESNPDLISVSHLNSQHGIIVDIGIERNNLIHVIHIQGLSNHRAKLNLIQFTILKGKSFWLSQELKESQSSFKFVESSQSSSLWLRSILGLF